MSGVGSPNVPRTVPAAVHRTPRNHWTVAGQRSLHGQHPGDAALDLAYVRTRNPVGDLSILLRTVPSILRDRSAR